MRRCYIIPMAVLFSVLFIAASWAESRQTDPHLLAAKNYREQAAKAFDDGDYDKAAELVAKARDELALIEKRQPLPATYTVRLIPEDRDCLWKIAGYPFVYNDPEKWPVLYRANREKLVDPENEDLILPGMEITIPSISCEQREGVWSPATKYLPFQPSE